MTDVFFVCSGCDDHIWPGETTYPGADPDTVRCGICHARTQSDRGPADRQHAAAPDQS